MHPSAESPPITPLPLLNSLKPAQFQTRPKSSCPRDPSDHIHKHITINTYNIDSFQNKIILEFSQDLLSNFSIKLINHDFGRYC